MGAGFRGGCGVKLPSRFEMLGQLAALHRLAAIHLRDQAALMFPSGSFVYVAHEMFTGHGYVRQREHGDDPTLLAVVLENGNTWFYPLECCTPAKNLKEVPRSVRRMKLRRAGMKCADWR